MKRSRIFLGVTTSLLAIAGVVAAKARFADPATSYYFDPNKSNNCLPYGMTRCVEGGQAICYYVTTTQIPAAHLTLYTDANCSVIARYDSN